MSDAVSVVWDDALLGYTMGGDHPLHPVRLDLTMRLADGLGVLPAGTPTNNTPATRSWWRSGVEPTTPQEEPSAVVSPATVVDEDKKKP